MTKGNFKVATKVLFLKYTIIPVLVIIVLFSLFLVVILHYKVIYETNQSVNHIDEKFNGVYESYRDEINKMSRDENIIHILKFHSRMNEAYETFYNFNINQKVKSAFYLIDEHDIFVASTNELEEKDQRKILKKMIPRLKRNPNQLITDADITHFSHGQTSSVTFGKAVQNREGIVGFIIFKLYTEDLQRLIFGEKADIAIVTDSYDNIIVSTNDIVQGLMNKFIPERQSNNRVIINNDRYFMKEQLISDGLFKVYILNNKETNYFTFILYGIFMVLIFIVLYFLLRMLAEKMSEKNSESIDKLLLAVSHLKKGKLTSFVNINTGDEFEELASQYNNMLVNLNELMKRNEELSNIRKTNEIKLLQSQFNPHFLFNVLEMLRYTMLTDVDKSQEIILSLASLLRYSTNKKIENIYLEEDMNYILDYLKLHKLRFDNNLHYHVNFDENVRKVEIPKLLLQPIIENSIKYGYINQTKLNIWISAEMIDDFILLKVVDDGEGIEKDKLIEIKRNLDSKSNNKIGIGLFNINRRLVLQYGSDYGIYIHSDLHEGTTIEIKVPYDGGEDGIV